MYFSQYFEIDEVTLENYGAFNISLINDLPLFIDPFLLFGSEKEEYQNLHNQIIEYLCFLRRKKEEGRDDSGSLQAWYYFPEIRQNWLGYSFSGNLGSGLGHKFANALSRNVLNLFHDIKAEKITQTTHLEKACLVQNGIGRDNISDFTCNIIKDYLLNYTQEFSQKNLKSKFLKEFHVKKAVFDYTLERWIPKRYILPAFKKDFVILTPKDILTKDENWINSRDLYGDFESIAASIPNEQLRAELNNYFVSVLPKTRNGASPSRTEKNSAISLCMQKFPKIIDYYIKMKEDNAEGAKSVSFENVNEVTTVFVKNVKDLIETLKNSTRFYSDWDGSSSLDAARKRVEFLKDVIENKNGYRIFYYDDKPIRKESDLQIMYRLTWYFTGFDVNREVDNGRGPVDFKVSKGSRDASLVEFKLASNSKLENNLLKQVEIYQKASDAKEAIKVILFFKESEEKKIKKILMHEKLFNNPNIILIDARNDNKPSASNA